MTETIYSTLNRGNNGETEFDVEVTYHVEAAEPMSYNNPGCPQEIGIVAVKDTDGAVVKCTEEELAELISEINEEALDYEPDYSDHYDG